MSLATLSVAALLANTLQQPLVEDDLARQVVRGSEGIVRVVPNGDGHSSSLQMSLGRAELGAFASPLQPKWRDGGWNAHQVTPRGPIALRQSPSLSGAPELDFQSGVPDTVTQLLASYEKLPLEGLSFVAEFQRALLREWTLGVAFRVRSGDSTGMWEYQSQTHQPYLSLGRDSLTIPLSGRSLSARHYHWGPWLKWRRGVSAVEVRAYQDQDRLDLPRPQDPYVRVGDPKMRRNFVSPAWTSAEEASGLSADAWTVLSGFGLRQQLAVATLEREERGLPNRVWRGSVDSLVVPTRRVDDMQSSWWRSELRRSGLTFAYEGRWRQLGSDSLSALSMPCAADCQEDRQSFVVSNDSLFGLSASVGVLRNSSVLNSVDYGLGGHLAGQWRRDSLSLSALSRLQPRWADAEQLAGRRTGWTLYPNPTLQREDAWTTDLSTRYGWPMVAISGGLKVDAAQKPLVPGALGPLALGLPWSESDAFRTEQAEQGLIVGWRVGTALQYGHWWLRLDREALPFRRVWANGYVYDRPDIAGVRYLWGLGWRRQLLQHGQLDLETRIDGHWEGERWAWQVQGDSGRATPVRLRNTQLFDLEIRTRIQSFQLFAQIRNLGHQYLRYAPGYTSYGAQFLWGITWTFVDSPIKE